jgi:hypothetical protein
VQQLAINKMMKEKKAEIEGNIIPAFSPKKKK